MQMSIGAPLEAGVFLQLKTLQVLVCFKRYNWKVSFAIIQTGNAIHRYILTCP